MITFLILVLIIYIINYISLKKVCKKKGIGFNPLEGTLLNWMIYIIGLAILLIAFSILIIHYLP